MSFHIVRNDIIKMNTEAIVNTANAHVTVGPGCDSAVYKEAGYEELLNYRKEHIGFVEEGEVFLTPGFHLLAKYIIHAVSPLFLSGEQDEERKLRSCYQKSLQLAKENGIKSIAFPLISTGGFGYPKEEGMRIAVDEINSFLLENEMDIFLVVFDEKATRLGERISSELEAFIDRNYVKARQEEEYGGVLFSVARIVKPENNSDSFQRNVIRKNFRSRANKENSERVIPWSQESHKRDEDSSQSIRYSENKDSKKKDEPEKTCGEGLTEGCKDKYEESCEYIELRESKTLYEIGESLEDLGCDDLDENYEYLDSEKLDISVEDSAWDDEDKIVELNRKLNERLAHKSDTFSEYLLFLIESKGMKNSDVYNRAIVDKRYFSKIKNNKDFHPEKIKALCLCVGAKLELDETKDLLARAGYALSPSDLTDIIFSFYIENKHYDVIDIDIQLEEHGLPCIIS